MKPDLVSALALRYGFAGVDKALAGESLEALELITTDPEGWPHIAWLSPGEVLRIDESHVGFALWPTSTTSANLAHSGGAVAQVVEDGAVIRARLSAFPVGSIKVGRASLVGFVCEVVEQNIDAVGYATVLSGPLYELRDREQVWHRWRQQLLALAEAVAVGAMTVRTQTTTAP